MKNWWAVEGEEIKPLVLTVKNIRDAIKTMSEQSEQSPVLLLTTEEWERTNGGQDLMRLFDDPRTCEETLEILVEVSLREEEDEGDAL